MFGTSCIQPIDMVKVRIQLKSESRAASLSPFKIAKDIYKNEGGIKAFYKGLDSALLRQAVYASLRLGLYFNISDYLKNHQNQGKNLSPAQKAGASLVAGAIGSFVGTPCDVVLVRMQADSTLPIAERRNYPNVIAAFGRIIKEEGLTTLWKGAAPTILRAVSMNMAMLISYDEVKERLTAHFGRDRQKSIILGSSLISAVATSTISLPFDNIKTKL